MDYSFQIETLKGQVDELKRIKDTLWKIEDSVITIEKQIGDMEAGLPSDAEVLAMDKSVEREQLMRIFDLAEQAYGIIDEILGPPEGEEPGAPREISLEEVLRQFPKGKKSAS